MSFKILCCDGGGIRGLITALLIQDLDKKHGIIEKSDGFSGTSTGGLIALGLANNVSIESIIEVYKTEGNIIFKPNGFSEVEENQSKSSNTLEALLAGPGLFACQYKNKGLKKIAHKLFGEKLMGNSQKLITISSVRLFDENGMWEPITFSNKNKYKETKY